MLAMFEYRRVNQLGVIAPNCHREAREIVDTLPKATAEETQKATLEGWAARCPISPFFSDLKMGSA